MTDGIQREAAIEARSSTIDEFSSFYRSARDPDRLSERLAHWHQVLWSRAVPGIGPLEVALRYDRGYEHVLSTGDGRSFRVGSDSIVPTWTGGSWPGRMNEDVREALDRDGAFFRTACSVGGYIVWPRNRADQRGWSINQARGMLRTVDDRFDITLECIRLHYAAPDVDTPLAKYLAMHTDFFALFGSFRGYVDFFLLDDLVTNEGAVRSLVPPTDLVDFAAPVLPQTAADYVEYAR